MTQPISIETHSEDETRHLGAEIGRVAQPGDILLLLGSYGAGKTTLVQGIAQGLGIEGPVTSPSFVLANEYCGRIPLYHIDLWRVSEMDGVTFGALAEYFGGDGICAVEWPASLPASLVDGAMVIKLAVVEDQIRRFTTSGLEPRVAQVFERCAPHLVSAPQRHK
jgi:tRNA threonylcarbamoyladenosine biosynthesis protein TsaE